MHPKKLRRNVLSSHLPKFASLTILLICGLFLASCSSHKTTPPDPNQPAVENADSGPDLRQTRGFDEDPWEPFNRAIFSFNNVFDDYLVAPVARGYDYILPGAVKTGVSNFFDNLWQPDRFLSAVMKLHLGDAGKQTGRFIINTTAGVGGLIDVAKHVGLPRHDEDIGSALGYWGVGAGPYLVVPFWGPSDLRDTFTRVADRFANPAYYVGNIWISLGATGLEAISLRQELLDATDAGKKGSLDYYIFIRNSYKQHRLSVVFDGNVPPELNPEPSDPLDDLSLTGGDADTSKDSKPAAAAEPAETTTPSK